MRLINKNTSNTNAYKIVQIQPEQISSFPYTDWDVLSDSVELYDNTDPENPVENYPRKYIKGITENGGYKHEHLNYAICTHILLMSDNEKQAVDEQLAKEEAAKSFRGFKYRLITSGAIVDPNHNFHAMFNVGLAEDNPRKVVYMEDGSGIKHIESLWNNIETGFMTTIEQNPEVFTLEINPLQTL